MRWSGWTGFGQPITFRSDVFSFKHRGGGWGTQIGSYPLWNGKVASSRQPGPKNLNEQYLKPPRQFLKVQTGVSKNRGKTPKMDGENNGKPY